MTKKAWSGIDAQPPSRVPYLDKEDLPTEKQQYLQRPISLFRGLANSPGALKVHHRFGEWIRWECKLNPRTRELIILLVGQLTKSPYEYSHHIKISKQFEVSDEDVEALRRFSPEPSTPQEFPPELHAALTATQELTEDAEISDATWDLLSQHYGHEELTDIVVVASFYSYVIRVLAALRLEVEPDYAGYLDTFPLD